MIKLFEEYNQYYYQIDSYELLQYWEDVYAKLGIDSWTHYNRLGYRINKNEIDYLMSQGFIENNKCLFSKKIGLECDVWQKMQYKEINVYTGLDEWFIVIIEIFGYDPQEYYKCDQWEGLLKLIGDKGFL